MREQSVLRGQSSNLGFAFILDTTSTIGAGLTGVTSASGSLNISIRREKSSAMTTYTGANIGAISTLGTWANPGSGKVNIKAVDGTNAPGLYELHFEDAIFNAGDTSRKLIGFISGVTNMAPTPFEIPLAAIDPQSATAFITGVNSLAPPTNWNLVSIDASGRLDIIKINGTSQTAKDLGAINVTTLNTLSGHDPGTTIGTSTLTQTQVTGGTYALNSASFAFNAATDFTTAMKTSLNAATPASVVGSVGSIGGVTLPANFGSVLLLTNGAGGYWVDANVMGWKGSVPAALSADGFVGADLQQLQGTDVIPATAGVLDVNVINWKGSTAPAMTGDAFARIGVAGAGLTALGDTRIAHLDADMTSRLATASYVAPLNATETANAVLDVTASGHNTSGTIGAKINTAATNSSGGTTTNVTITERDVVIR